MHLETERSSGFCHLTPSRKKVTAINTENIWKNGSLHPVLLKPQKTFSYSLFLPSCVSVISENKNTSRTKRALFFLSSTHHFPKAYFYIREITVARGRIEKCAHLSWSAGFKVIVCSKSPFYFKFKKAQHLNRLPVNATRDCKKKKKSPGNSFSSFNDSNRWNKSSWHHLTLYGLKTKPWWEIPSSHTHTHTPGTSSEQFSWTGGPVCVWSSVSSNPAEPTTSTTTVRLITVTEKAECLSLQNSSHDPCTWSRSISQ